MTTTTRRWESRGGKYWVELTHDDSGYSYRGHECGGCLGKSPEALAVFMRSLLQGYFQADANVSTMREVTP